MSVSLLFLSLSHSRSVCLGTQYFKDHTTGTKLAFMVLFVAHLYPWLNQGSHTEICLWKYQLGFLYERYVILRHTKLIHLFTLGTVMRESSEFFTVSDTRKNIWHFRSLIDHSIVETKESERASERHYVSCVSSHLCTIFCFKFHT